MAVFCDVRPRLLQPCNVRLTHTCPARLPLALEVLYDEGIVHADYIGHGMSRTVYSLRTRHGEAVLKLAETESANAAEVAAFAVLSPHRLSPRLFRSGGVALWDRAGTTSRDIAGMLVERVHETLEDALLRCPSADLVLRCAQALVECSRHGVLVSDCHPGNWGILADGKICLIDSGNRGPSAPVTKGQLNDKAMQKLWQRLAQTVPEAAVAPARELWQRSHSLEGFLACRLEVSAPRANPWQGTPDVDMQPRAADPVQVIVGTTGWFVDSLECIAGERSVHCGGLGGDTEHRTRLLPNERVLGVLVARNAADGSQVLGRRVVVRTTSRTICFKGSSSGRVTDTFDLTVEAGREFCGLAMTSCGSVRLLYEPPQDAAETAGAQLPREPPPVPAPAPAPTGALVVADSTLGSFLCAGHGIEEHGWTS